MYLLFNFDNLKTIIHKKDRVIHKTLEYNCSNCIKYWISAPIKRNKISGGSLFVAKRGKIYFGFLSH